MMIEFNGPITEENQLKRIKKVDKEVRYPTLLFGIILLVMMILSMLIPFFKDILWDIIICLVIYLAILPAIIKTPKKVALRIRIAPHVIITDNEVMLEVWDNGKLIWWKKNLSKVKKVLDCGELYYIILKHGGISTSWICQKSNIVNGTIEEFETIFESKIVKEPD